MSPLDRMIFLTPGIPWDAATSGMWYFLGLHVCQMMGYEEIMNSYRFISTNAAKTLHLGDRYGIKVGNSADFVILDAKNYYEALRDDSVVLRSYKNGKLIASTKPAEKAAIDLYTSAAKLSE